MTRSLKETAIGNLHLRQEDAFEFFVIYARYEYAAKVLKLVHIANSPIILGIDPQKVADLIRANFLQKAADSVPLQEAIAYYAANPPSKQMWDGVGPTWELPVYQGNDAVKILLLQLAQARNNLFHGGKGWKTDIPTAERDNDLLRHGLVLLEAVITSDASLFAEFSSYA